MFRFLKFLFVLVILGAIGLFGYSYILEPETKPVTTTIPIDAG